MKMFAPLLGLFNGSLHGTQIAKGGFNQTFFQEFMVKQGCEFLGKFEFKDKKEGFSINSSFVMPDGTVLLIDVRSNSVANNKGLFDQHAFAIKKAKELMPNTKIEAYVVFFLEGEGRSVDYNNKTMNIIKEKGFTPISFFDFSGIFVDNQFEAFRKWEADLNSFMVTKSVSKFNENKNLFLQEYGITEERLDVLMKDFLKTYLTKA